MFEFSSMEPKDQWAVYLELIKLFFAVLGGVGAFGAFAFGIHQWRVAQSLTRAEALDKLIREFEENRLIQIATVALDWAEREVEWKQSTVKISTRTVFRAMRSLSFDRETQDGRGQEKAKFEDDEIVLRDAMDAFLSFYIRLSTNIESGIVKQDHARRYFGYWLERFAGLDGHSPDATLLREVGVQKSEQLSAQYVTEFADIDSIKCLYGSWNISSSLMNEGPTAVCIGHHE